MDSKCQVIEKRCCQVTTENSIVVECQMLYLLSKLIFTCDFFKALKHGKLYFLGFLKLKDGVLDLGEHPKRKEGNISTLHA